MKKIVFLPLFILLLFPRSASAQNTIPVLTLGTFHFNFPNLDRVQIPKENQIDILELKYQEEIDKLVKLLARFEPTVIAIERPSTMQNTIDSLYQQYLAGNHTLHRSEDQQIGFRLAKYMSISKLYCVDEWGEFTDRIDKLLDTENSEAYINFERSFNEHPDSVKRFQPKDIFKDKGIIAELIKLNNRENVKRSLGNYLIGHFKYEAQPYDYTGVDFETGRWFNRNLRIFRNIQRIETNSSDRLLIIFGAGHMNILNYLFECSPEYSLEDTNQYLE